MQFFNIFPHKFLRQYFMERFYIILQSKVGKGVRFMLKKTLKTLLKLPEF